MELTASGRYNLLFYGLNPYPVARVLSRSQQLILFSLDDGATRCCERRCKSTTSPEEAYLWSWLLDPSGRGMACRISHCESCYRCSSRAWRLAAWPPRANRQLFGCFAVRVRMWCHRNLTTRAFPLARASSAPGRTLWFNLLFPDFLSVTYWKVAMTSNQPLEPTAGRCEVHI